MNNSPRSKRRLLAIYAMALVAVALSVIWLPAQTGTTILTPPTLPEATAGAQYSTQLQGNPPVGTWFLQNSSLPFNLTLNFNNGLISGVPVGNSTTPVTSTFRIQYLANDQTTNRDFSLTINPPPILPNSLPNACLGLPYSATVQPSRGTAPYTVSLLGGSLPQGLSFVASNASLTGTPTEAGSFQPQFVATDRWDARVQGNVPLLVANPPQLTTLSIPSAVINQAYTTQLLATASTSGQGIPPTFSLVNSSAPFHVNLTSSGVLTTLPTVAGTFALVVRVGSSQCFQEHTYTLNVQSPLSITTLTLPNGRVGASYNGIVQTAGGFPTVTLSVSNGSPPPGLQLSSDGRLTGTPTQGGSFTFTVRAQDSLSTSAGGPQVATRTYTVEIESTVRITTTSLPNGLTQVPYNASLQAEGGTQPYTFSVDQGSLPPGLTLSSSGAITGTPTQVGTFSFRARVTTTPVATLGSQIGLRDLSIRIDPSLQITTTALTSGTRGRPFVQQIQATGGTQPLTWSIESGSLPSGLTFSTAGVISGTPTAAGTSQLVVRVTDRNGLVASRAFTLVVQEDQRGIIITTRSLPNGDVTQDYSATVSATGDFVPFVWSVEGLPPGLSLNSAEGTIRGRPTTPGSYTVVIRVRDAQGNGDSSVYNVTITGSPVTITTVQVATATVGESYNQSISASGGTPPYRFAITTGTLAPGLSFSQGGVISGTPTEVGSFAFTVETTDQSGARGSRGFTLQVQAGAPTITTESLGSGVVNQPFNATLAARGGTPPYRFSASGLPPGLSVADSGAITGTPTGAGSFSVAAIVTDRNNRTGSRSFTLVIAAPIVLNPATFAPQITGQPIGLSVSASGGVPPYQFSLTGGSLPGGVSLSSSGAISGTTEETGTFQFEVTVRDNANHAAAGQFSIAVSPALVITTTTLPAATVGSDYSAQVSATGGQPPLTFSSVGDLPDGLNLSSTGEITGTYRSTQSSSITVLVQDQGGQSVQRTFAIQANQPPPPQGTIGGLPQNPAPSLQPTATLTIASPFPLEITGTLTLTFAPNAAVNADDPTIRFANNTRTINFRIPAGQTQAIFEGSPAFQTGSTAGTITLTAALNSGGQSVTTTQTVVIPRSAPTITSATAQRSGNTITLTVTGFSTTRDITAMTLRLTGAASTNLQTTELTPPVTQAFATWFGSTQGQSFGSEFRLSIPLTVEGDAATAITGIQVVLTNSAGSSSPTNATIQ